MQKNNAISVTQYALLIMLQSHIDVVSFVCINLKIRCRLPIRHCDFPAITMRNSTELCF